MPKFKEQVKEPHIAEQGFVLYYTHQCPFTAKYVPLIEKMARARGIAFQSVCIDSREKAQNAPAPVTTYSLFFNGEFVTHEILSDTKFLKILEEKDLL